MKASPAYIAGRFLCEGKTRFVAWVEVEGRRYKCYVPMSTKLSRYFNPVGCQVRMVYHGKRLWVDQIKCGHSWLWVNAAKAKDLMYVHLARRGEKVESECLVSGYRFDLYRDGVGYEVKSILTTEQVILYPNAESERREEQLCRLLKLLRKGQKVELALVSLSPLLHKVKIDLGSSFGRKLRVAIAKGLKVSGWCVCNREQLRVLRVEFKEKRTGMRNRTPSCTGTKPRPRASAQS